MDGGGERKEKGGEVCDSKERWLPQEAIHFPPKEALLGAPRRWVSGLFMYYRRVTEPSFA